jgi:cardiolipin synthase
MVVDRGVSVQLMVPGHNTDNPLVRRAGCALYDRVLEAGVRLYEYEPTLLHQKVVIVDGVWSHVGSTNFDARSLALNEEVGVGVCSRELAGELRRAFDEDLKYCQEITRDVWKHRPLMDRLIDRFAYRLHDQL